MEPSVGFDALLPSEMAGMAEDVGVSKARLGAFPTFSLGVLAGAFIALGAVFSATSVPGAAGLLFGAVKVGLVYWAIYLWQGRINIDLKG